MSDCIREWMDKARFMAHIIEDFPDEWRSKHLHKDGSVSVTPYKVTREEKVRL